MAQEPLPPGSTIGILGGGQLGRMMAMAAAKLGYHVHIYCPEENCPATEVSKYHAAAAYDDDKALQQFSQQVDVATLEFENIPLAAAKAVENHTTLYPSSRILEICQHRIKEKQFINNCGISTAPFAHATNEEEALTAIKTIGLPCIMKTCTSGYDGKGQVKISDITELKEAWDKLASDDIIIEALVPFEKEASIIVARNQMEQTTCYPLVENIHKNHILYQTIAPADLPESTTQQAQQIAILLAEKLELVGILAVELFVYGDTLLVNELAPRPHNSGHWTLDACQTDQFEQTIRAVTDLPLAKINQHSAAVMTNLIGKDIHDWLTLTNEPHTSLHLYGKKEARNGRKMGHVTKVSRL